MVVSTTSCAATAQLRKEFSDDERVAITNILLHGAGAGALLVNYNLGCKQQFERCDPDKDYNCYPRKRCEKTGYRYQCNWCPTGDSCGLNNPCCDGYVYGTCHPKSLMCTAVIYVLLPL
uniref:Uncharacterized protein n=1 Tax=Chenopodium quinoa TaxID=63459 RepID=A0A803KQD1_CHEQI